MAKDGSIYLKPLTRGLVPANIEIRPEKFITILAKELGRRMRARLRESAFSEKAKVALAKAMKITTGLKTVTLVVDHPAWKPLTEGQKSGQMLWLRKARRPIPIVLKDGTLIFRNATARSFANGRWVHPGRPKADFVEKAKQEVREQLKKKIKSEVRKILLGR
jgi:hypothetical protein